MAQASELSQVQVADPRGPQLRAQDFSIELRVVSRARDTAHIYDALDAVCPQNLEKLFPSACGMPIVKTAGISILIFLTTSTMFRQPVLAMKVDRPS
jgi:hypothetical protein